MSLVSDSASEAQLSQREREVIILGRARRVSCLAQPSPAMMEGESVFLKCMLPLRSNKKADNSSTQESRSSKRGSRSRFALGDIFGTHDEDKIRALRDKSDDSSANFKKSQELLDEVMAELEGERARTNEVQRQLNLAMNLNTELKLSTGLLAEEIVEDEQRRLFSLKMKLREERKAREAAEATASTASTEIERLHASLEATLAEKQHLEAELLEAAYDLLQKQKLETALQEATQLGKDAQCLLATAKTDSEELRGRLRRSEEARRQLEKELTHLRAEASKWEDVLDTLQDQLDQALVKPSTESQSDILSTTAKETSVPAKPEPCGSEVDTVTTTVTATAAFVTTPAAAPAAPATALPVAADGNITTANTLEGITEWCERETDGIVERLTCTASKTAPTGHNSPLIAA